MHIFSSVKLQSGVSGKMATAGAINDDNFGT